MWLYEKLDTEGPRFIKNYFHEIEVNTLSELQGQCNILVNSPIEVQDEFFSKNKNKLYDLIPDLNSLYEFLIGIDPDLSIKMLDVMMDKLLAWTNYSDKEFDSVCKNIYPKLYQQSQRRKAKELYLSALAKKVNTIEDLTRFLKTVSPLFYNNFLVQVSPLLITKWVEQTNAADLFEILETNSAEKALLNFTFSNNLPSMAKNWLTSLDAVEKIMPHIGFPNTSLLINHMKNNLAEWISTPELYQRFLPKLNSPQSSLLNDIIAKKLISSAKSCHEVITLLTIWPEQLHQAILRKIPPQLVTTSEQLNELTMKVADKMSILVHFDTPLINFELLMTCLKEADYNMKNWILSNRKYCACIKSVDQLKAFLQVYQDIEGASSQIIRQFTPEMLNCTKEEFYQFPEHKVITIVNDLLHELRKGSFGSSYSSFFRYGLHEPSNPCFSLIEALENTNHDAISLEKLLSDYYSKHEASSLRSLILNYLVQLTSDKDSFREETNFPSLN